MVVLLLLLMVLLELQVKISLGTQDTFWLVMMLILDLCHTKMVLLGLSLSLLMVDLVLVSTLELIWDIPVAKPFSSYDCVAIGLLP